MSNAAAASATTSRAPSGATADSTAARSTFAGSCSGVSLLITTVLTTKPADVASWPRWVSKWLLPSPNPAPSSIEARLGRAFPAQRCPRAAGKTCPRCRLGLSRARRRRRRWALRCAAPRPRAVGPGARRPTGVPGSSHGLQPDVEPYQGCERVGASPIPHLVGDPELESGIRWQSTLLVADQLGRHDGHDQHPD